jgi:glutamine transport system ATP-binding protein
VIVVKNLHKSFDKLEVLKGIDCHIHQKEVVCVIGPSGSGKSTFLRCINRLEEAQQGQIFIDGEEVTAPNADINRIRQEMGMVFQLFNLFPHKTTLENVTLAPIKIKNTTNERIRNSITEVPRFKTRSKLCPALWLPSHCAGIWSWASRHCILRPL